MSSTKINVRNITLDIIVTIISGIVVSIAYYFFQNSNGFAPGGVGGLATMTYHLIGTIPWAYVMLAFNIPIFILVTVFVDKKVGVYLIIYMLVQSLMTEIYPLLSFKPYSKATTGEDFQIVFACIATGVIAGTGFSIMLRHFGASGGTYAITSLIKKKNPALSVAFVSFIMDSSVVLISFFVYGMQITPVLCTLINLFVANVVVDYFLSGAKTAYKFEIVTDEIDKLSTELIEKLHHGVTDIKVVGMYSHTDKHMLVCIVRKREIGQMMKILKNYKNTFANFSKVNEVFGRFHK